MDGGTRDFMQNYFLARSIRNLADLADIHQPRPAKSYGQRAK